MVTRPVRPATQIQTIVGLDPQVAAALRSHLAEVADSAVLTIIDEVPSYAGAWSGRMGEVIRNAVQLALGGFLTLATRQDVDAPKAPAIEGAYQLGRGEARSGRTVEALLAAYRIGARASWRDMSGVAVEAGVDSGQLAKFAELVFAYIDELSAASVAGHTDELESSGRVRQRNLERLARALLTGAPADAVDRRGGARRLGAARRADRARAARVAGLARPHRARPGHAAAQRRRPGAAGGPRLAARARHRARPAHVPRCSARCAAPTRSSAPACRGSRLLRRTAVPCGARRLGVEGLVDSDEHLASLVLAADASARDDLRARVLAPLADLRPSTAEKLTDTLRSWLLNHGRRDAVAEELFVHAQTVRYRVGQLREIYGDRLEDPAFVLDATLALA